MLRFVARRVIVVLVSLGAALGVTLIAAGPAWSDELVCVPPAERAYDENGGYVCIIPGGGGPGRPGDPGDGGGQPAPPPCLITDSHTVGYGWGDKNPSAVYCMGQRVCFDVDHYAPLKLPEGEPPNEDSKARVRMCWPIESPLAGPEFDSVFWSGEEEIPSTYEQAMQAIGRIVLPTPDIHISPANRSIVNLDTWFWAEGLPPTESGSSAFGLVAYADFDRLVVDPGDGTGTLSCTATTSAAAQADCHHEYVRSSVRGSARVEGRPAFAVSAEAVYALRFEVGGNEVAVPGAPTTLTSPTATAALRVDEVQSVVTPRG
ncbi:hypothetical protein [Mumia zhuanghuii]|uniref:Uncharacterized protein n=1 Tax=Mumia zhuanghuii TaxID=2585211 RepID=A0A5C4MU83_9ACTN|nr:hypothetical protein [Mumia zhuanghuii]TNC47373.1 hypothetical protein FHE65_10190 [Mumia zhuanghuii]TNC47648.1 hypothetical protein FHE65_09175 [Mumia zhuanghuii]